MMVNVKSWILEAWILSSFFVGFGSHDIAQILACAVSITCGFGLRMVMIVASGGVLGRGLVSLHAFATVFMSWAAYQIWESGIQNIRPFSLMGLQVYLILCSFMAVYLIQSLDRLSRISIKAFRRKLFEDYIADDKKEEIKP